MNPERFYLFAFYVIMCLKHWCAAKKRVLSRCLEYAWIRMYPHVYEELGRRLRLINSDTTFSKEAKRS